MNAVLFHTLATITLFFILLINIYPYGFIHATVISDQPSYYSSFGGSKYSNDPNAGGDRSNNKNIKKICPPNDPSNNNNNENKNKNRTFNDESSTTNITSQSQISISNKSCSGLPGQYDVTLSDSVMQNPNTIKSVLNDLTQKVVRSGVKVTNVLENIGIFGIKSMNQQLLNKVIDDLRHDPRIASVQRTVCVGIDSLGP